MTKPWWYPVKCDADYCNQLREDMQDAVYGMSDEELVEEFNDGLKYQRLWDHIGDAYEQFEPLAEAYLELESRIEFLEEEIDHWKNISREK